MYRNSILYHRLWYVKKRNLARVHIYFKIFAILIILALLSLYSINRLLPFVMEKSELRARNVISYIVNTSIRDSFSEELKYENLVTVNKNSEGKITSIQTDVSLLDHIAAGISSQIDKELAGLHKERVNVPLNIFFGSTAPETSNTGVRLAVQSSGRTESFFKNEFTDEGMGRTKHSIVLEVKADIHVSVLLFEKRTEVVMSVPVSEAEIIGEIPSTYLSENK